MIIKKIIQIAIAGLIPLLLLTSCGNDSTTPSDGEIELTPINSATWAVTLAAGACPGAYPGIDPELHIFRITAKDSSGNPLGKVDLDLSMVLTDNSSLGGVAWLLIDLDNDGLFDGFDGTLASVLRSQEFITAAGAGAPYKTTTNEFGWLEVGVMLDLSGCSFAGWLAITSGAVGSTFDFDVTAS